MPLYKSVLRGLLAAGGFIFSVSTVVGVVELYLNISDGILNLVSAAIISAAAFFAGYFSTQLCRTKGLLQGLLCGALLYLSALLISLAAGEFVFSDMALIKAAGCLISGTAGGITGVNTKKTVIRH